MNSAAILDDITLQNIMQDSDYRQRFLDVATKAAVSECWDISDLMSVADGDPVVATVSSLLAQAKRAAAQSEVSQRLALVVPMWREVRRLQPKSEANPHGENCAREKLRALDWLFSGTKTDWHVFFVDDDCPEVSSKICSTVAPWTNGEKKI
ncbi:hypothetical protein BTE77_33960 [Ensifer adhaerens]|nr:hypothetical protein BTE77_33960 [Ensifer adhaerens]